MSEPCDVGQIRKFHGNSSSSNCLLIVRKYRLGGETRVEFMINGRLQEMSEFHMILETSLIS
jgi:hypothetical protein